MQSLRLFCDVARCLSLSEAAGLHGITQSAASQRVQALEARLGVQLLDRSVRPLALTPAGQRYAAGCEAVLNSLDALEAEVRQAGARVSGVVRVSAIYSAGIGWLNRVCRAFEQAEPEIKAEVHYQSPDAVHQAVLDGRCDLGIVSYPQRWNKVQLIPLRDEPMVVACRPDHALIEAAAGVSVPVSALGSHPMFGIVRELPLGQATWRFLKEHAVEPEVVDAFDNIDTIKSALAEAGCFAILPLRTIRRELDSGTLAAVKTEPSLYRPMGVIHRRARNGHSLSAASQRFADFLVEHSAGTVTSAEPITHTDQVDSTPPLVTAKA